LIKQHFDLAEVKRFDLLCGSPYHFQGSERDIILLSFGVCDQSHPSAFVHINKPEVFNVAITRAKSYQYIFTSVSIRKLNSESLLSKYLSFAKTFSYSNEETGNRDTFQEEVIEELEKLGLDSVESGYPIAGSILDILVTHKGDNYFIDLIGYPGAFREAFSQERYKTLARTGIKSFPLHYSIWKKQREDVLKKLDEVIILRHH
jgi:hypothetical protein